MHESKQDFRTDEFDHHFTVDGRAYCLPGIQMGDIVAAASLADIDDPKKQVEAFRDFMISRVTSDTPSWVLWVTGRSIAGTIRSLAPSQLSALFAAWSAPSGGIPGEALGSQVSTPDTDAS